METKVFKLQIKELDEEAGRFQGYLSVFGNVDHGGDIVEKGAFTKTLQENTAFPLLWAHSAQEPNLVVGSFHGTEDKHGLLVNGEFFKELPGGKDAYDIVKKLKEKHIKIGLSIGYKAVQWKDDKVDDEAVRRLKEIQLYEGSLTLFPMNDQATIQAIKDDLEQKPYPNNHACVIDASSTVVGSQTRNHEGKRYTVRLSKEGDHSYLYPIDVWSEAEARAHCKDHEGTFEAAAKSKTTTVRCGNCGTDVMVIYDPVSEKAEALESKEPAPTAIPEPKPPIVEDIAANRWYLELEKRMRDLNSIN